jgi:hypothetical protein
MRTQPCIDSSRIIQPMGLCRHIQTCGAGLVCLLGVVPAARAHHDDGPIPPERVLWGLIAFVIVLTWLLFMCQRAPRALRKRPLRARRKSVAPKWLERLLYLAPGNGQTPTAASRQVRRAFERRRR